MARPRTETESMLLHAIHKTLLVAADLQVSKRGQLLPLVMLRDHQAERVAELILHSVLKDMAAGSNPKKDFQVLVDEFAAIANQS